MNILITGGCGFVGSNLAIELKKKNPAYNIYCMDNLKRRGSELNIPRLKIQDIKFIHGDIRNKSDFDEIPAVDMVIEAAAEPSVLAGLNSPTDYLIGTNLNGTINCLDFAKKHQAKFIFLSTSRIYPIRAIEEANFIEEETRFSLCKEQKLIGISNKGIAENFPLDGARSLYGTTKLSSELIIQEYNEMFGLKTIVNRCGVLTGPYQMGKIDQGVVVLWVARHFWKGKLGYFGYGGTGKQVRDMLHIHDLFRLIDYQIQHIEDLNGETFNVGGGTDISISLQELTKFCEKVTGNSIEITCVPENRAADIRIYITDNSKVTTRTGWKPEILPEIIIKDIYEWIRDNETDLKPILN